MPKKQTTTKASTNSLNEDMIRQIDASLSGESPSQSDFQELLKAQNGSMAVKALAAQIIPKHVSKFPSLSDKALEVQESFVHDSEFIVQKQAIRLLTNFIEFHPEKVYSILFDLLKEEDIRIINDVIPQVQRLFEINENFQKHVLDNVDSQPVDVQAKLLPIIKEGKKFENEDELFPVIEAAMKKTPVEGINLLRANQKLLSADKKALLGNALLAGISTIDIPTIKPLIENIRLFPENIVDTLMAKVGSIKISDLDTETRNFVLQRIGGLAPYFKEPTIELFMDQLFEILESISNQPGESTLNFGLIEQLLFDIARLSRVNTRIFSKHIGKAMVLTGQPSEVEGIKDDPRLYKQFTDRLAYFNETADQFIDNAKEKLTAARENKENDRIFSLLKAVKAGKNVKKLTRMLSGKFAMSDPLPDIMSYQMKENYNRPPPPRDSHDRRNLKYGKRPRSEKGGFRGGRGGRFHGSRR